MQNDNQAAIREMLKSFAYLLDEALKKTTKTYEGIVLSPASDSRKWNVRYNNEIHAVKLYGSGTPTVNMMVKVIIPQGNQALAWFFVPGSGGGGTGDGATFYPSVSEDGIISWTNDKSLPNPEPVNIKGPQGNKGDTGEQGPPGTAATIQIGTVVSGTTPSVTNSGTEQNAIFNFVLEPGPQGIQGVQGEQGATGPEGPQGEQGETGPYFTPSVSANGELSWTNNGGLVNPPNVNIQGPKGDTGVTGPQGEKGDPGEAATIQIGTVTSGDAPSVTNSGTLQNAIFDFVLQQGPQGPQGIQGQQGPTGPQGSQGEQGRQGETGPYFTPSVDSSGDLSWTNNGGLVNPSTVNIRGPQGIQGEVGATGPEGPAGKDGLTTSVNGVEQVDGNITLILEDFGVTATTTEINYLDGVTSNIQAQLNSKISENIVSLTLLSGSSNWTASSGKYYQDLTVSGMTTNIIPYVFPNVAVTSSTYSSIMDSWNTVVQVESIANGIRIWANSPTSTNVPLTLHYI